MKHLASFLLFMSIATGSFAAAQMQKIHNLVKNVIGNAFVKDKKEKLIAIKNGASLKPGDIIYTGPGSSFEIHFEDESVMTVTSLTVMKVDELLANQNPGQSEPSYQSKFKLRVGEVRASVSRKTGVLKKFEVQTPVGTASVRGTEKIVNYSPDAGMKVNTLHGQVLVMANNGIEKYVNQGEFTKALGMQTQLPQAELQLEQAKPFITNESEQYILENRGLEVTQEANQILVSQVTKEQSQGPEAIVEAHQGTQQGASKTPAENARPTSPLVQKFDEAEALKKAEELLQQRYQQVLTTVDGLDNQRPQVPSVTYKEQGIRGIEDGGLSANARGVFQDILTTLRNNLNDPAGFDAFMAQHRDIGNGNAADVDSWLSRLSTQMERLGYIANGPNATVAARAQNIRGWLHGIIAVEDREAEIQVQIDALEHDLEHDKSQIVEMLKAKFLEAQKAEQANLEKEFQAQMQGKGQASQQVQQLIDINKLVAGL